MFEELDLAKDASTPMSSTGAVLEAVLDAADSLLIVVLDEAMHIRRASTGICALLGWTRQQAVGRPFASLFEEDAVMAQLASPAVVAARTWSPAYPLDTTQTIKTPETPETPETPQMTGRARLRTREGFFKAVRLTSAAVLTSEGVPSGTVVIAVEAAWRGKPSESDATSNPTSASCTPLPRTTPRTTPKTTSREPSPMAATAGAAAEAASTTLASRGKTINVVQRQLADSEELLLLTFEKSPTAMAIISLSPATLGRVRRANTAFEVFTGRRRRTLLSMSVRQLLHPDEVPAHLAYLHLAAETGRSEPDGIERRFVHADGHTRWARKTTAVVTPSGASEPYLLVQLADTTAQRAASEALAHAALHDPLTGLANRALFADRLELALTTDQRARCGVSLLYLDLDAFKPINDRYGHAAGDAVLVEVARRLGRVMRGGDTVARLGGDEFAVICPGLDSAHLPVVLARVRRALRAPVRLPSPLPAGPGGGEGPLTRAGLLVEVGVSIGTATSTCSGSDRAAGVLHAPSSQAMVAAADQSMYAVKQTSSRS